MHVKKCQVCLGMSMVVAFSSAFTPYINSYTIFKIISQSFKCKTFLSITIIILCKQNHYVFLHKAYILYN